MILGDVCEIQSGYTARGRLEPAIGAGIPAIQLRDVDTDGSVDLGRLSSLDLDGATERYMARSGDILFRSRGQHNTATSIPDGWNGSAVAIMPLVLLRPHRDIVDPTYLAWLINQPPAQLHFDRTARGTSLRMIPMTSLQNLDVMVPDLQTQRAIAEIADLAARERSLSDLIAQKRQHLMSLQLLDVAKTCSPNRTAYRSK
tara:strand:+ start:5452 stop:6054 length:603 start_codon:yes stop_codon:yes gene_type:complete